MNGFTKNTAIKLAGSGGKREKNDFYPTPRYVTELLLKSENFSSMVWEPACGAGDISLVLSANGFQVYSTDLNADKYGFGEKLNFLSIRNNKRIDNIITNPPFSLATEFILKSKELAQSKIALFLRTNFLEGEKRYKMFKDKVFPLKCIYQFTKRVAFGGYYSGMLSFAWFVWDKSWIGEPTIRWFDPSEQKSCELLKQQDIFAPEKSNGKAVETMELKLLNEI